MGSVSSIVFVFDIQKNPQSANVGSTLRPDVLQLQRGKVAKSLFLWQSRRDVENPSPRQRGAWLFVVLASPQFVRRITANRSPQSGQPAKFLLISPS
jgi:hypothetical protein